MGAVEFGPALIGFNESLLRQVGGVAFILERAKEVVEEFGRVTVHEIVQCGVVTCREAGHIVSVLFVAVGLVHDRRYM